MKAIFATVAALTTALFITGCASKNPFPAEPVDVCKVSDVIAPKWVCTAPQKEGMITAVVSAHSKYFGSSLAHREAMSTGQSHLKQRVHENIQGEIEQFIRSSGGLNDAMTRSVSAQVSSGVAYASLKHFRELEQWENKTDKKLYLLVGADRSDVNLLTKRSIAKRLRQYSPLKQWTRQDFPGDAQTAVTKRVKTSDDSQQMFGYTREVELQNDEPLFMAEEPMVEVVDERIVGRNRPR